MERRKFIAGLGSFTAAGAAGIGTGAFSSVRADRSITVQTAEDPDAYLKLSANSGANRNYALVNEDGELVIDFDSDGDQGEGTNPNAVSKFDEVFRLANHGTGPKDIWFEHDLPGVTFYRFGNSLDRWENRKTNLAEGAHKEIGIKLDTTVVEVDTEEDISGIVMIYAQDSDKESSPSDLE